MFGWLKAAVNRLTFSRHRNLALIADWLANALWLLDASFLNLAKKAYGGNAVAYACIRLLANSISEAPLKSYTEDTDGSRTELDRQHPLNLLIKRPNELMTEYEMWELTTIHISIAGHAFWWKHRTNGGQVDALWPLRPDRVGPIYSDSEKPGEQVLLGWSYQDPSDGQYKPLPRRDVLSFNFPDPADESGGIVEGLGPIQVLSAEVSADNEATSFVGALLKNYATPSMMIKMKMPVRNEDEAAMVKAKASYEFGSGNRGKVGLVDGEADVVMTGFSLQQLEFPDLRDVAESRIAAVIGVPPILVGLKVGLKSASIRANFGEARQYFAETTVTNYWRRYQDQFTNDVAAEFGDNIVCAFDTSSVRALAGQRVERIKPIKDGFTDGAVTVNEYRAELGLPALAGGDVRRVPTNVVEVPVDIEKAAAKAMGMRYLGPGHAMAVRAADPRDDDEARLQDALVALFEKQRPDVARKIANNQPVSDDELSEALRLVMQPELTKTAAGEIGRIGAQIQVQFDPAIGNVAAADWAKQYTYELVKDIAPNTRKVISQAIDDFTRTPGMTVGQLSSALEATGFGRVRAEMIAITETTRAYTAASVIYKDELAKSGINMLMKWHTAGDEKVCFQCGPLDGTMETEWKDTDGPPRHPRCRCATSLALAPKAKPATEQAPTVIPSGKPVSGALSPSGSMVQGILPNVTRSIDSVHGDGNLPSLPVRDGTSRTAAGEYVTDRRKGPQAIVLSKHGENKELSLLHEIGHFLDDQGSGVKGTWSSEKDSKWASWRKAVAESQAAKDLNALASGPARRQVALSTGRAADYTVDKRYVDYLRQPSEMWARSYAQYIARKSGSGVLSDQVKALTDAAGQLHYPTQWADADFAPIEAAIDRLLRSLGWTRGND